MSLKTVIRTTDHALHTLSILGKKAFVGGKRACNCMAASRRVHGGSIRCRTRRPQKEKRRTGVDVLPRSVIRILILCSGRDGKVT
eukprot:9012984-Pyramimonas_sp.AAC.1